MNGSSAKAAIPYVVIAALIALGLAAAVVRALDWEGDWVVGLLLAAAIGVAGWKVWTDIVKPRRLNMIAGREERRHSEAVGLSLSNRTLSVVNRGTHEVRSVEITALVDGGDMDEMLMGPSFQPSGAAGVEVVPMPGTDFMVRIAQLTPTRGWGIGTFQELHGNQTSAVRFDVAWIDHAGRRRSSTGSADVLDGGSSSVPLTERPQQ